MDKSVRQKLTAVYGAAEEMITFQAHRYEALLREHGQRYPGSAVAAVVRAPGRVNLIGEHTDYNGYPVLPMAIDRDIVIAFSAVPSSRVCVENMDTRFPRCEFETRVPIPQGEQGDWGNYLKAAVQGIIEAGIVDPAGASGLNAVCSGSVPESAGLSSSSALVVAMGLAFLTANDVSVPPLELAGILARAERYAGLEGGGMDQTISLMGSFGHALKIDFSPVAVSPVHLPEGAVFVVCNSLVAAPKTASARNAYNRRVVECRLAMALLAAFLRERAGLRTVPELLADLSPEKTGLPEKTIAGAARDVLHQSPWQLDEIATVLGIPADKVRRTYCTTRTGSEVPEPEEGFLL
ncbi:MAG: hypothetical protein OEM41_08735, partial [Ignavibacteria bacterium]|nr:hypothetical protein [Ignavibacteria bacterium]